MNEQAEDDDDGDDTQDAQLERLRIGALRRSEFRQK
jgi:hypothetical protein